MSFDVPLGHADAIRRLWRSAAEGRLAHALLLTGPAGIGKFRAMRWFGFGVLLGAVIGGIVGGIVALQLLAIGAIPPSVLAWFGHAADLAGLGP